jgi:hypothetical protein
LLDLTVRCFFPAAVLLPCRNLRLWQTHLDLAPPHLSVLNGSTHVEWRDQACEIGEAYMSRLIPAAAGSVFAILLMSTTAWAHGCHQTWQQGGLQGWHRHGPNCETRQGQGHTDRSKQGGKRRYRISAAILGGSLKDAAGPFLDDRSGSSWLLAPAGGPAARIAISTVIPSSSAAARQGVGPTIL